MNRQILATAIVSALIASVLVGVGVVWYFNSQNSSANLPIQTLIEQPTTSSLITDQQAKGNELELLTASVSALEARVFELENATPTSSVVSSQSVPKFTKETLYLGSAETTKREWTDTGLEVTLNSADYPSGVVGFFEAGMSIVGGNAQARLINKSTGAIINLTELTFNASTTVWKSSPSFNLYSGANMYHVQIRSSSGEKAHLAGARLILDKK